MRVLMVNDVARVHGGAEVMIQQLMAGLQAEGHEVRLLAGKEAGNGAFIADSQYLSFRDGSIWQMPLYVCNPFALWQLRKELRRFRPDIVHLHNVTKASPFVFWLLKRRRTVLTLHDHVLLNPTALERMPSLQPYKHTLEDFFIDKPSMRFYVEKLRFWLYRKWFRHVGVTLACSRFFEGVAKESGQFPRLTVVANGIKLPQAHALPSSARLLFSGRLDSVKGADVLVEAMPSVVRANPSIQLDIAGSGSQQPELQKRVIELGLGSHVHFLGHRSHEEMIRLYKKAMLIVLPSRYPENFGLVAVEALATGRPVVASAVGGVPEIVTDGKTGKLVPADNPAALAKAICDILALPRKGLERLSRQSRERAERFDSATYITNTLHVYTELLSDAEGASSRRA